MSEKFSSGRKTADKQIRSFPREKGDNFYQLFDGSNTRTSPKVINAIETKFCVTRRTRFFSERQVSEFERLE